MEMSWQQTNFLTDLRNIMIQTHATFDPSQIDELLTIANRYGSDFGAILMSLRSSDVRNGIYRRENITVHKGDIITAGEQSLSDELQNKIKVLITKTAYDFNTIKQIDDTANVAYYRNKKKQGRVLYMISGLEVFETWEYILLEKKYSELLAKIKVLESKCDTVEDVMFPSVVDKSIQGGRFDQMRDALFKANNQDLFSFFKTFERRFAAVDDEFNPKPEIYTAFAITREASKILVEGFIIDADGNPIPNPDIQSLKQIMEYHIVSGELKPEDIRKDQILISYNGLRLKIHVKGEDVFVNNSKILTLEGIEATNGIVYVIDAVLAPLDEIRFHEAEALPALAEEGGADLAAGLW
jgi:uncharacterized surface protein with fasciclin (FAS1) repeats